MITINMSFKLKKKLSTLIKFRAKVKGRQINGASQPFMSRHIMFGANQRDPLEVYYLGLKKAGFQDIPALLASDGRGMGGLPTKIGDLGEGILPEVSLFIRRFYIEEPVLLVLPFIVLGRTHHILPFSRESIPADPLGRLSEVVHMGERTKTGRHSMIFAPNYVS